MAGPIAEAFVAIRPEFGAFDNELRSNLAKAERLAEAAGEGIEDSFVEAARQSADAFDRFSTRTYDDATRGADRAGEQIEDSFREAARQSESRLKGINFKGVAAGLAGLFAGVQLGSFFKDATLDAQRLNSAIANTEQIIEATGGVAGITADQIRSSSQALSLVTGVAAVDIQEASNVLLTFKNVSGDAFGRAQQAGLDMAAVLGTDINAASIQLGKALNDPVQGITALNRVGVTFTDTQKEQVKAMVEVGDVAGAQNLILNELEGQMGGAAEASADSTAKIGAAFTALKESVGQGLIGAIDSITPAILGIVDSLGPVATQLGDLVGGALEALLPSIEQLLGGLAPLFDILGSLIPILAPIAALIADVLVTAIEIFAESFGPLFDALGPLIKLLAGELAGVIGDLAPIVTEIATIFSGLLARAIGIVVPVIQQMLPIVTKVAALLGGVFATVLETLGNAFLDVYEAVLPLLPILGNALLSILAALAPVLPIIANLFAQVATTLVTALVPIIEQLVPLLASVVVSLVDALVPILPVLADLLLTLLDALLPILPAFLTLIESILPILVQLIEALSPLLLIVADVLAAILVPAVELLTGALTWLIENVLVPIFDYISANFQPALETLGDVATDVGGKFETMGSFFKTVWDTVLSPIVDFITGTFIALALNPLMTAIGAVATAWDVAWAAIKTVKETVVDPIYDFFNDTFGLAFGAAGVALEALGEVFSTVWGGIQTAVETAVEAIRTAINVVISGWNSLNFTIPKFDPPGPGPTFGPWEIGLPYIAPLATGGIVTEPTLTLLGDNKSRTEAVIPLERAGEFGFGHEGGAERMTSAVTIQSANFYDGTDADLVAQRVTAAWAAFS